MEEMRDKNGTRHEENKYKKVRRKSFLIRPSFLTFNCIKCKQIILNANSSFQKTDIKNVNKYTIQHPPMIKILTKTEIEENFFNNIKDIYEKPTADLTFSGERLEAFPLILGTRQ